MVLSRSSFGGATCEDGLYSSDLKSLESTSSGSCRHGRSSIIASITAGGPAPLIAVLLYQRFGLAAGDPSTGYYSYNLGAWHIIVINSSCADVGGCGAGSAQEQWLRADLGANPAACTLAYWHHPLFSSGEHGNNTIMLAIWQALYDFDADVVLGGHDHDYERFAPQAPDGAADPARGMREFIVGTGGKSLRPFFTALPNSEVREASTFGVLKLTLSPTGYTWQFVPVADETFTDTGSDTCH